MELPKNALQTLATLLANTEHKIEDVLEPDALALGTSAKEHFEHVEAVGIGYDVTFSSPTLWSRNWVLVNLGGNRPLPETGSVLNLRW